MGSAKTINSEEYLARAKELVAHIEAGDEEASNRVLDELTRMRESELFRELGKLTRELHEALNNFRLDARIADLAEKDIPDAKDRLNYVITMTEQAANRTLDLVEESIPLAEEIKKGAAELRSAWERFRRREMDVQEFRSMAGEMSAFLERAETDAEKVRANLSEVLMAQDFQDLTGQVIKRVIHLVQEVEENLVSLIRISGQRMGQRVESAGREKSTAPSGPPIPGRESSGVVKGQDDVDDLLSSLGF